MMLYVNYIMLFVLLKTMNIDLAGCWYINIRATMLAPLKLNNNE